MRAEAASAALLLVAAIVVAPNHPTGRVPAEDAGVFFYAAERLLVGGLPYRDVWDHKPPGVYLVDAAGLGLAGPLGVWLLQLASLAAAALLGRHALRTAFGEGPALLGSFAWLVASPRLFLEDGIQTSFAELFALPFQFGALALVAAGPRATSAPRLALIGALGGGAVLVKPTVVAIWVAIAVVLLVAHRTEPRRAASALGALVTGALVPLAIVGGLAAARGVLGEMLDQALAYNRAYAAFAPLDERAEAIMSGLRLTLPSGLAILAVGAWSHAIATRAWSVPLVAIALVALPLELLLGATGRGYHYYFLAWLPAMAVLAAYGARALAGLVERRAAPGAAGGALVTIALLMSLQPLALVTRLAPLHDDGAIRATAAHVAASTRPEDTVLVWGSHAEVLFLAGRRSPTRYVYQYAALSTRGYATVARVDELLADLERARPALVVDASRDSFVTPPLDRAAFRAWRSPEAQYAPLPEAERIIAFVEANYERAGEAPGTGWPLWRSRAP